MAGTVRFIAKLSYRSSDIASAPVLDGPDLRKAILSREISRRWLFAPPFTLDA